MHPSIRLLFAPLLLSMSVTLHAQEAGVECDPARFAKVIAEKPGQVLDVRTPEEWATGVIAGARFIDFNAGGFKSAAAAMLDRTKPVFVYCAAGGRSYRASKQLKELGFAEVYDLVGGMGAWKEAGMPTVPYARDAKR
ncbi:MAG TPA: rhodanese-like domain-containing protein [Flavobacteriales bacterium]|nr:rhodanese-like domain-containing protein [Flavobacteriales bacterium]HMR26715.1 rhodanese-like domain-containing protein [Flavobacteriales bacterium]